MNTAVRLASWALAGLSLGTALLGVYDRDPWCFLGTFLGMVWFVALALVPGSWWTRIMGE